MNKIEKKVKELRDILDKLSNFNYTTSLIHWDLETGAPKEGIQKAATVLGFYSELTYNLLTDEKLIENIDFLGKNLEKLTEIDRKLVIETKKDIDRIKRIPVSEYKEYNELLSKSQAIWGESRAENDYNKFKPYLQKIVDYNKKYAEYKGYSDNPYNALIDDFEPGMTVKQLDIFFEGLRKELVPFIEKINKSRVNISNELLKKSYSVEKQKELSIFISKYLGFDFDRGILKESLHPFTMGLNKYDVRITTHYHENFLQAALFGTIHEAGHAIYEQNIGDDIWKTVLGTGNSMGIHESQSRFYENLITRTKEFWKPIYSKLVDYFPENLKDISLEEFYNAINRVENSLIRIEADELTYSLHIMIRYEIEKGLINGEISLDDLPSVWNKKMEDYLGIVPETDSEGVLQDVHWAAGLFGYFPSYALGSANASQIMNSLEKVLDVKKTLENQELDKIKGFLEEKIHKYGRLKDPNEIMLIATGEEPNSKYYIDYLIKKYSKIYNIE